jgi:hypothetical protein
MRAKITNVKVLKYFFEPPLMPSILEAIDKESAVKSGKFIGQILFENGVPDTDIQKALIKQAVAMVDAVVKDAIIIKDGVKLDFGALKPHWGNKGVNDPIKDPNLSDGMSALANVAKLLLLFAGNDQALIKIADVGINAAQGLMSSLQSVTRSSNFLTARIVEKRLDDISNSISLINANKPKEEQVAAEIIDLYINNRITNDIGKYARKGLEASVEESKGDVKSLVVDTEESKGRSK